MRKRNLSKTFAILICFVLISLSVPHLVAAESKAPKLDIRFLWEKPLSLFSSLVPILSPLFGQSNKNKELRNTPSSGMSVIIMGNLSSVKTGDDGK